MFNPRVPFYHPHSPKQSTGTTSAIQPDTSSSRAGTAQAASTTSPFVPAEDIFQPSHFRHVQGPSGSGPDEQEPDLFHSRMQQAFPTPETGQPAQFPMLENDDFLRLLLQEPTFPDPIFPEPALPEPALPPNVSQDSSRPDKGKQPMTMQPSEQSGFFSHEPSGSSSSHQPFNPLHEDFLPESFSSYQANLEDAAVIEQLIAMGGLKPPSPVAASHHQLDSDAMPDAPWHEDDPPGESGLETQPTSSGVKKTPGKKRKRPPAPPKDPRRLGLSFAEQKRQFLDFYHAHKDQLKRHEIVQKFRDEKFYLPGGTFRVWLEKDGIKKISKNASNFDQAFSSFLKRNTDALQHLISKPQKFILENFLRQEEGQAFSGFHIRSVNSFLTGFLKRNPKFHQKNQNPQRKKQFLDYFHAPENENKTIKQRRKDFSKAFFPVPERTASAWLKEENAGLSERGKEFQEAFLAFYRKNPELADQTKLVQAEKFLQSDESGDFSKLTKGSIHNHITSLFQYNPKLRDPHYREEPQPEQLEARLETSKTKKHSKTEIKPLTKKDLEFQAAFGVFYKKNPDLAGTSNNRLGEGFTKQEEGKPFSNLSSRTIQNHISKFFKHNPELRAPQQLKVQAGPSVSPTVPLEDSDHMIERSMDEQ